MDEQTVAVTMGTLLIVGLMLTTGVFLWRHHIAVALATCGAGFTVIGLLLTNGHSAAIATDSLSGVLSGDSNPATLLYTASWEVLWPFVVAIILWVFAAVAGIIAATGRTFRRSSERRTQHEPRRRAEREPSPRRPFFGRRSAPPSDDRGKTRPASEPPARAKRGARPSGEPAARPKREEQPAEPVH